MEVRIASMFTASTGFWEGTLVVMVDEEERMWELARSEKRVTVTATEMRATRKTREIAAVSRFPRRKARRIWSGRRNTIRIH